MSQEQKDEIVRIWIEEQREKDNKTKKESTAKIRTYSKSFISRMLKFD